MSAKSSPSAKRRSAEDAVLNEAAALLAFALPPVPPPAHVKARLLARVRAAQTAAPEPAVVEWRFGTLGGTDGWVPLPFPGVRMREVTIDAARDTALLYVEMEPRSIFPDHEHTAAERGLVLTGDLQMSGRSLSAGDFYEAAAGTKHERITSQKGCTGLLWVGADAWRKWRAALTAAKQ
jgi:anti-sigma factor ChrR (cupin superfamily)